MRRTGLATDSPKAVGRELLAQIEAAGNRIYAARSGERTEMVLGILRRMGRQGGHKVAPYGPRDRREFLCDLTWQHWRKSHPLQLQRLVLAAECEWGGAKAVAYDFKKLLPLKAPLKLCIYRVRPNAPQASAEKMREAIGAALQSYQDHSRGEHYLLVEVNRQRRQTKLYHLPVQRGRANRKFQLLWETPVATRYIDNSSLGR